MVKGLVLVKAFHDVFAITKGIGELYVPTTSRGVGIAGNVQPVSPPSLTETGRGEEVVHDIGKGIRRFVIKKVVDLLRRGRKTS